MIVDTSAIVAILRQEPGAQAFANRIEAADHVAVAAASVLESHLVLGPSRRTDLDAWLDGAQAEVAPVDVAQLASAREAHDRYGRGSGSPARLNFGDCFSYALAAVRGEPLLFKGADFTHTDIEPALPDR